MLYCDSVLNQQFRLSGMMSPSSLVTAVEITHFSVPKFPALRSTVRKTCEYLVSSIDKEILFYY